MTKDETENVYNIRMKPPPQGPAQRGYLEGDRNPFGVDPFCWNRKLKMSEVLAHPLGPLFHGHFPNGDGVSPSQQGCPRRELERKFLLRGIPPALCYHNLWVSLGQKLKGERQHFFKLAGPSTDHIVHEGAKAGHLCWFDVYKGHPKNANGQQKGHRALSRTSTGGQHPAVEKISGFLTSKSHQVPGRKMEKNHRQGELRAKGCIHM
ncbi:hypothetical protein GWK47_041695 [Chionoecetes opilio]|uniref:Uncharacterized protein n=1 Tax=Chionoecetes opilio TaxID=41210 RepID=A0A8J4Y9Q0_CHIOP|nr:hypothetical protein GWK47_041695 [Chionoecetes opilio]